MRRVTWILAISGMMALQQNGYSADPAADQPSARYSAGSSRTLKPASNQKAVKKAADPASKNYYKDLFGDEEVPVANKKDVLASDEPQQRVGDWDDDSIEKRESSSTIGRKRIAIKTNQTGPSLGDLPTTSTRDSVGGGDKLKAGPKVSQAQYDRPLGKKVPIQQVRGEGRKNAPPPPTFDDPADTLPKSEVKDETLPISETVRNESGTQNSHVTVEWMKRGEFNVGQECLVDLIVKNTGTAAVSQVAIDAIFPTNVRLTAAEPRPAAATDRLTWTFDQLPAASERKITIKLIPSRRGEIGATAQVRFTETNTTTFAVSEPLLKVALKAPSRDIMLGDPASQMITVTNPGTGTAHDVKLEAKLSDGLEHPSREDHLVIDVGAVGPGETRSYRLGLTASKGGKQTINVVATSSSEAASTDSVQLNVIAPSLKIAVDGPALRYRGRNAKFTLTVTNDGSLANNNIHITQSVSDGFKFVSADHQGRFDASTKSVHWIVGRLESGDSAQVSCELNSVQIGEFAQSVHVVSESGVEADAKIETRIDGIASLTMELVDLDDPVETGSETAYEIRVKNDGSKVASDVVVACELPPGMELLSAKAPVDRVIEGRQLTFKPIEQIAPGSQVTIRVHMKVIREGTHRMKVRLAGGGLQEPMVLEEVTRAYSDGSN